jgi:cytochrome c5
MRSILAPASILPISAFVLVTISAVSAQDPAKSTVKDGVYSKAQAEAGKALYTKVCAKCHMFKTEPNEEAPALGGENFFKTWDGRSVYELATQIKTAMPPDGSVTLTDDDTANAIAFILQTNGFPDGGDKALKTDATAKNINIVKPAASHRP